MNKKLFIVIFLVLIVLLGGSEIFKIEDIEVGGEQIECVSEQAVKQSLDLMSKNFLLVDLKNQEKNLEKFICIKKAEIVFRLPKKIRVSLSARKRAAVIIPLEATAPSFLENLATPGANLKKQFIVDDEGMIFAEKYFDNLTRIYVHQSNITLGKKIEEIKKVLKIIDKVNRLGIEEKQTALFNNFFLINPYNSPKIIFRLPDIENQLASLQLILEKAKIDDMKLEFIDLRFDKPVVKFAPKNDQK